MRVTDTTQCRAMTASAARVDSVSTTFAKGKCGPRDTWPTRRRNVAQASNPLKIRSSHRRLALCQLGLRDAGHSLAYFCRSFAAESYTRRLIRMCRGVQHSEPLRYFARYSLQPRLSNRLLSL